MRIKHLELVYDVMAYAQVFTGKALSMIKYSDGYREMILLESNLDCEIIIIDNLKVLIRPTNKQWFTIAPLKKSPASVIQAKVFAHYAS